METRLVAVVTTTGRAPGGDPGIVIQEIDDTNYIHRYVVESDSDALDDRWAISPLDHTQLHEPAADSELAHLGYQRLSHWRPGPASWDADVEPVG